MARAELAAHERDYVSRLLVKERAKWASKLDHAASHAAIERRDRAASCIAAIDTIIGKLTSRPDESEPVESDQPTPSSHADVGPDT